MIITSEQKRWALEEAARRAPKARSLTIQKHASALLAFMGGETAPQPPQQQLPMPAPVAVKPPPAPPVVAEAPTPMRKAADVATQKARATFAVAVAAAHAAYRKELASLGDAIPPVPSLPDALILARAISGIREQATPPKPKWATALSEAAIAAMRTRAAHARAVKAEREQARAG